MEAVDWIITGIAGENYPCKPDTFERLYTPARPYPVGTLHEAATPVFPVVAVGQAQFSTRTAVGTTVPRSSLARP